MKLNRVLITIYIFGITIFGIEKSMAKLFDNEKTSGHFAAAEYFESCEEEITKNEDTKDPELLFFINDEETEVGFLLEGVSEYDQIEYAISYVRDGGLLEVVASTIYNTSGDNTILRENFTLGYCSAGGTCVYHSIESPIECEIKLYKSGILQETLTDNLIK